MSVNFQEKKNGIICNNCETKIRDYSVGHPDYCKACKNARKLAKKSPKELRRLEKNLKAIKKSHGGANA